MGRWANCPSYDLKIVVRCRMGNLPIPQVIPPPSYRNRRINPDVSPRPPPISCTSL